MATLFKSLAKMLTGGSAAPQVNLAAFGKHPGWNDHIDDLGLDSDNLVSAKQLLYSQGINQNIDAGAWEKLEPDQRINEFSHDFLWHMPGSLIAGRLWSSVDGKGRDKYPLVLCVQSQGLPDKFAVSTGFPFLSETHKRCVATKQASRFREVLDTDRTTIRSLAKDVPASEPLTPQALAAAANHPDMGANREGFHRIVYQFTKGMAFYSLVGQANTSKTMVRRPEQVRVPTCGMSAPDALLFWLRFSLTLLDPNVSILLIAPDPSLTDLAGDANGWVDIIVGEPNASNLFCMKAKNKTLPLTSEIPYTLDEKFTAAVNQFIEKCAAAPDKSPLPAWPAL